MPEPPRIHHYYYSAYHLAGDFIWGVSIFSLFVALGAIVFAVDVTSWVTGPKEAVVAPWAKAVSESTVSIFMIVGLYTLIGAAAAVVAQRAVPGLFDLFSAFKSRRSRGAVADYGEAYKLREHELTAIYTRHFADVVGAGGVERDGGQAADGEVVSSNDMVNRLLQYMKLYNPEGFSHVYRTYSIVGLFRQAIVFSAVLLALALWRQWITGGHILWLAFYITLALGIISYGCLRMTIERSVAAEFDFIFATSCWITDQRQALQPR